MAVAEAGSAVAAASPCGWVAAMQIVFDASGRICSAPEARYNWNVLVPSGQLIGLAMLGESSHLLIDLSSNTVTNPGSNIRFRWNLLQIQMTLSECCGELIGRGSLGETSQIEQACSLPSHSDAHWIQTRLEPPPPPPPPCVDWWQLSARIMLGATSQIQPNSLRPSCTLFSVFSSPLQLSPDTISRYNSPDTTSPDTICVVRSIA